MGLQNPPVYLHKGEEDELRIEGYVRCPKRDFLCHLLYLFTLGFLRLVFHWKPNWHVWMSYKKCPLAEADTLLIRNSNMEYFKISVKVVVAVGSSSSTTTSVEQFHVVVNKPECNNSLTGKFKKNKVVGTPVEMISLPSGVNCAFQLTSTYRVFSHRKHKYIWRPATLAPHFGQFDELSSLDSNCGCDTLVSCAPLSETEAAGRRAVYGLNEILVEVKPIGYLVFLDALNPFYVFQVFSVCVWMSEQYYYYAACIIAISVASVAYQVYQTRHNQTRLRNTVHSVSDVTVLRPTGNLPPIILDQTYSVATYAHKSASKFLVSSTVLVPGDLITLPRKGCTLQCDALLLTGDCIVNESMLTGESVPVTKTPMSASEEGSTLYNSRLHARQTLFCGTKVLQTKTAPGQDCVALVLRTGFRTTKGQLVRSIMYPKEVDFRFVNDLLKFVGVLAIIAAVGFIYTIALMSLRGYGFSLIAKRALDIITIVVPPALPAVMTIGIMSARQRLEKANIFCISPNTINTCGAIDCVNFDKTGTLTEDSLSFMSAVPAEQALFLAESNSLNPNGDICAAMATCHSLIIIDDQLLGDPIDMALFSATSFTVVEPTAENSQNYTIQPQTIVHLAATNRQLSTFMRVQSEDIGAYDNVTFELESVAQKTSVFAPHAVVEIAIVKQFPFGLNLQRMSVVTQKLGSQNLVLYCKGAPEMIASLSRPDSVPTNFTKILSQYTSEGYRVLAVAQRLITEDLATLSREEAEIGLTFVGLLVLENKLKPESTPVLFDLKSAFIRTNMVTGDNIQTAVSVAFNCGMLSKDKKTFIVNVDGTKPDGALAIVLEPVGDSDHWDHLHYNFGTVNENRLFKDYGATSPTGLMPNSYQLAVSGATYDVIRKSDMAMARKLVALTTVWARMAPELKATLVNDLQDLGYVVSMCGDGANDCSALKASHAGISLSEAEASIASPFTSKTPNISCVPILIREGRCALVTSFSVFKFMAVYSLTQFFSVCLLYWISSDLADFQFLYEDLYLVTTLGIFFGNTKAARILTPELPPTRVLSVESVCSILSQMAITIVFQLLIFYFISQQPWFIPLTDPLDANNYVAHQVTGVFLLSAFQYITFAIIYSKSLPHRRSILTNWPFTLALLFLTTTSIWITLGPPEPIANLLNLKLPPLMAFRGLILLLAAINFAAAFLAETLLVDLLIKRVEKANSRRRRVTSPQFQQILDKYGQSVEWLHKSDPTL